MLVVAVLILFGIAAAAILTRRRGAPPRVAEPRAVETAPAPERPVPVDRGVVAPAGIGGRIRSLFAGSEVSDQTWGSLEETLIRADVGAKSAAEIVARVKAAYQPPADPADVVATEIARSFEGDQPWLPPEGSPGIVMVVGVNGTGKTTSIGKLAEALRKQGRSVSIANSDTFRAAATEQVETWGRRSGAHVVAQERGADPGAVAFDAVQSAKARGTDVLVVDTAGRLHTRQPLMDELAKVKRVLEKAGGTVSEVLLVLDATTGQNGIAQAQAFMQAVDITGVILTKMDGTARGGIVLAVRSELGVPVKLIGTGEGLEDLEPFDARSFARQLVA